MANYIMGYWDCQYCGTKGNRGDRRECESCGHPRDESVKFYMKNTTHVSKETASSISKNPDWYCSYCNTLNSDNDSNCKGCGASKNESEKNYFTMRNTPSAPAPVQKTSRANPLKFLGILAAIAFVLFLIFKPRDKAAEIKDFSWYRYFKTFLPSNFNNLLSSSTTKLTYLSNCLNAFFNALALLVAIYIS